MGAVLHGLLYFSRRTIEGHPAPDYKVLRAMLYYIDVFPSVSTIRKRTTTSSPLRPVRGRPRTSSRLEKDHARRREDPHAHAGSNPHGMRRRIYVKEFADLMEDYAEFHWRHMGLEEDIVLPLAERILTEEDWGKIDAAFSGNADPLVGIEAKKNFDELFKRIVMLAPPPIGVGPEPSMSD
jgi:hypothetical protein